MTALERLKQAKTIDGGSPLERLKATKTIDAKTDKSGGTAQSAYSTSVERADEMDKMVTLSPTRAAAYRTQLDDMARERATLLRRLEQTGTSDTVRIAEIGEKSAALEKLLNDPSGLERAARTVGGGVKQYGSSHLNTLGMVSDALGGTAVSSVYKSNLGMLDEEIAALERQAADMTLTEAERQEARDALSIAYGQRGIYEGAIRSGEATGKEVYNIADTVAQSGAEDVERAKQGLGFVGQLGVDLGVQGTQMLLDRALGGDALSLLALGTRSFGGSAQEARQEGATREQAALYGLGNAAVEVLAEKLVNGLAGIYGKGSADEIVERLIARISQNPNMQDLLSIVFAAGGEGAEEIISGVANPLLKGIYNDNSFGENLSSIEWGDVMYDALVGSIMGGLGGTVETTMSNVQAEAILADEGRLAEIEALAGKYDVPFSLTDGMSKAERRRAVKKTVKSIAEEIEKTRDAKVGVPAAQDTAPVETANIERYARVMGDEGAQVIREQYDGAQDEAAYASSMLEAYAAGREGRDIESVKNIGATQEQVNAAYLAGMNDKAKAVAMRNAAAYNEDNNTVEEVEHERGSEEARRRAFAGDGTLHWTDYPQGVREATERRAQFRERMVRSGATVRGNEEKGLYGYRSVSVGERSEYAKRVESLLKQFGVKDYFVFDGEVQANRYGRTQSHGSEGLTLKDDGAIGINNRGGEGEYFTPPEDLAAHETIHHKIHNRDKAVEAYRNAVIENTLVDSDLFGLYFNAINNAYFGGNLDFWNDSERGKFFDEFCAYNAGHIFGGTKDNSSMFADFEAVKSSLEKAFGVEMNRVDEQSASVTENEEFDEADTERWTAERVGDADKKPMTLSEIVEKIRRDFDLNITTGHIRGAGVRGQYNRRDNGIRTKVANNLPTIAHELGHALDRRYALRKGFTAEVKAELEEALGTLKSAYSPKKWHSEGLAEYIRKFLQNRETAAIDYPNTTKYILNKLSGKDAALLEQLADEVNAYYSLDATTATSAIRLREEGGADFRTALEKIKSKASVIYKAMTDSNHGIKLFDEATGADTYKLATNAAYSDAIAGQIIAGDLTDANGQYVAPGLKAALNGIDLNNKDEYRLFGEYLTVRHGPERLKEGQRIFADDRKNSTSFMERRQAELEAQYPQFKKAAERLYSFQTQFLQTWGVDTGLVSAETAKEWGERWSFYVPLNRAVSEDKRGIGAKRGFANQNSTIKKARGSGLEIVHPVDNIVNNLVKMVNAGVRNNVMRKISDAAETLGADAGFMEKVPAPMVRRGFDLSEVKTKLTDWFEGSDMQADEAARAAGIVSNLDDILYQYGKGKAYGDVITVLKNGKQEFWKINDPLLLESITNMSPSKAEGVLDAFAIVSRFMTGNITGNNIVWSLFSNFPRDLQTFFIYSKEKNPVKVFSSMGSAYVNKFKGDGADPLYKEYLAMGGGKTSAYTADRDLARRARKKLAGKKFNANPLDWLAFVGDTVESGPRFATYKMMRENGLPPQEAFYEAMDITVNFRRGGTISRQINKIIPFFNASVQGLDKFQRWIRAADAPKDIRAKVVRSRVVSYIAVNAALAALSYAINNRDEEAEEDYEQLSNYTKNSYWNIGIGDGKYFSIPKAREHGVLSSFFETCMEYGIGDNKHAFDEFYSYFTDNCLPIIASDAAQGDFYGAVGSLGIIGVVSYMGANRDFLGRPIVSASLQNLEPKDQYTNRTSAIAKSVGQAFNMSPQMIDYFFNSVLGGWWKYQKALFPVGRENVDYTLGVQNSYIKDNQYSTDLVNWLYDKAETSSKKHNSDSKNMDKAITAKMDDNMKTFYSRYYARAKTAKETELTRGVRQTVLSSILEYQKASDSGSLTPTQKQVYAVCKAQKTTAYLPIVMQNTVKDGKDVVHTLSDAQYVEYQTEYLRFYWEYAEDMLGSARTEKEKAAILNAAKETAKDEATKRVLARISAAPLSYSEKYSGVENDTLIEYRAKVDLASEDGGFKQDEAIAILKEMVQNGITNEEAYMLFHSNWDSDKNNPWRRYKP